VIASIDTEEKTRGMGGIDRCNCAFVFFIHAVDSACEPGTHDRRGDHGKRKKLTVKKKCIVKDEELSSQ
jgi:hypothetical protein